MYADLATLCIERGRSILEAVARMDRSRLGIVLVVDAEGRLAGTVTDGDVRRAVLAQTDLNGAVETLLARKAGSRYARPITAPAGAARASYLKLLQDNSILHLPLLDPEGRVVGLVTLDEFVPKQTLALQAVIMAGGYGNRLRPFTDDVPKPMLPVGDRPLMEITLAQLREAGIQRVNITTHHKPEKITEHFGDGRNFGLEIRYVTEDRPLGTAGGLGLIEAPQETVLVINGDILTEVDFGSMLAFHREHGADLTVAVRQYELQVPYGVVECETVFVRSLTEKPQLRCLVNAGIYLLEPSVHRFIPSGEPFDMTELIQVLLEAGRPVASFPIREYWLDIGQHADYERAQERAKTWKPRA